MTRIEALAGAKSALVIVAFCNFIDIVLYVKVHHLQSINFLPPLCVYAFVYSDYGFYRGSAIA
jgi:hypothetical protein